MNTLEAIRTRRSTRAYSEKAPSREQIETVINAGRYAPSGGNSQTTHFIVITKKSVLSELADLVRTEFAKMEDDPDLYASIRHSIQSSRNGDYVFHYHAPVFIVTANQKGYGNAMADSACALENMMLAANELNLGSCWINQLHWLDDHAVIRNFLKPDDLEETETITGGLILGYPAQGQPDREPLKRTGNPVTWVEEGGREDAGDR